VARHAPQAIAATHTTWREQAPLPFEHALREYLADYALEEETEEDAHAASDNVEHEA
jgi:hypothetical protein